MDFLQILDLIVHIDQSINTVIQEYGTLVYVVLFAIVFAETGLVVMFFLPGDTLLFIAGAVCLTGAMNIWLLMILLIVAAVLGNTTNYWIGGAIGHRVFTHNFGGLIVKHWIKRIYFLKSTVVKPSFCRGLCLWYVPLRRLWQAFPRWDLCSFNYIM
jgi:membrane protein YqaA with SNARE-associated domain